MRFPNLKTATLCLLLLFVYDAFWVFGSEHLAVFEGKNVMVEVATKQAANPAYEAGAALGWEWMRLLGNAHLELPIKLLYPTTQNSYQMLGLGDIALPGILVNLAYHFDVSCLEREREVERDGGCQRMVVHRETHRWRALGRVVAEGCAPSLC